MLGITRLSTSRCLWLCVTKKTIYSLHCYVIDNILLLCRYGQAMHVHCSIHAQYAMNVGTKWLKLYLSITIDSHLPILLWNSMFHVMEFLINFLQPQMSFPNHRSYAWPTSKPQDVQFEPKTVNPYVGQPQNKCASKP